MKRENLFKHRWTRIITSGVVTLGLLVWALWGISPGAVSSAVRGARLEWLAVGLIAFLASHSVRAWRWGTLLGIRGYGGGFGIRQSAIFIGFAGNFLLPAKAGEIIRAAVLNRRGGIPFGKALGSIVAERLLDAIVVFLFLLTPLLPGAVNQVGQGGLGVLPLGSMSAVLVVTSAAVIFAARWPERVEHWAGGLSRAIVVERLTPRIVASVSGLLKGFDALRSPRRGIIAMMESVCVWALIGITFWAGMLAFGITSPGATGALFVGGLAALGFAIPSSPGSFGPFEAAIRLALGMYAVPTNIIIAYALTLHLLMCVTVVTIGFVQAARLGLSWADLVPRTSASLGSGKL